MSMAPPKKHMHTFCLQVEFFNSALASAEEEQARLRRELKEQKLRCQRLAHLVAPAQDGVEKEAPAPGTEGDSVSAPGTEGDSVSAPGTGGDSVPVETHQALQVAMDKLQVSKSPPPGAGRVGACGQVAAEPQPYRSGHRAALLNSCKRKWI